MSAREKMAAEIADIFLDGCAHEAGGIDIAKAILDAGYAKRQQLTSVEELDALPLASVAITKLDEVISKRQEPSGGFQSWWAMAGTSEYFQSRELPLPATLLYSPTVAK